MNSVVGSNERDQRRGQIGVLTNNPRWGESGAFQEIYILLDASGSMANQLDAGRAHPWPIEEAIDAIDTVAV